MAIGDHGAVSPRVTNSLDAVPQHDHSDPVNGGQLSVRALAANSQIARLDKTDVQTFAGALVIPGGQITASLQLADLNTTPLQIVIGPYLCTLGAAVVTDAREWVLPDASGTLSVGGSASLSSASVAFTDGDTYRRVTITDAAVSAAVAARQLARFTTKTQAAPCLTVGDQIMIWFGGDNGVSNGLISGAAAINTDVTVAPAFLMGQNHCMLLHFWAGSQSAAPSFEVTVGWWER